MTLDVRIGTALAVVVSEIVVAAESLKREGPILVRKATLEEKAFGALNDSTVRALDDAVRLVPIWVRNAMCRMPSCRQAA